MSSPPKKRSIADFFKPYIKSAIPAKRPSPSVEETSGFKSPGKHVPKAATPKSEKRKIEQQQKTPSSLLFSPSSGRPSTASHSIPYRSPRPKDPIDPPSTYTRAPRFGADGSYDSTPIKAAKPFSFADLPSSTHAVIQNGKVVEIRDSDDDDTDSLASLESLDDIFGGKKGGHVTSLSSSPGDDEAKLEAERVKTLSLFTSGRSVPLVGKDKLRALYAKERANKFDISGIVGHHFDDEEVETIVRKARAELDASTKDTRTEDNPTLDKELLAKVAATEDGEDGLSRLMDAVDRTEALTSERVFLFFGADGLSDWHDDARVQQPFPDKAIPYQLWRRKDDDSRARAFISGMVTEVAANRQMPDEALNWVFHNVVLEPEDDLRNSYIECLRAASSSWARNNVTAKDVHSVFRRLGADPATIQDSDNIQLKHRPTKESSMQDPRNLLAALHVFQAISQDMDFLALSKLTSLVCRLALDRDLMSDAQVSSKVEEVLEVLLSLPDVDLRSHVSERILTDLGQRLKDATLQAQLLSHILPTSDTACRLRILLAQTFLLGVDVFKEITSISPQISLELLAEHVSTSPSFDTRRRKAAHNLDYVALQALTHILDVAVSDGGRPETFSSRVEERAFNKSVDHLADSVRSTFVSIVDAGASHMTRTEAKDVLQALHWRLLYSVRTEVRPKRNIFDGKTGRIREAEEVHEEEKSKDFMQTFLAKRKEKEKMERQLDTVEAIIPQPAASVGDGLDIHTPTPTPGNQTSSSSSARSETEVLIRRQLDLTD